MAYNILKVFRRDADTSAVADGQPDQLNTNAVGRLKVSAWPGAYSPTTGSITTATSTVVVDISRAAAATVGIAGTHAGVNATFEVSVDGTNYVSILAQQTGPVVPLSTTTGVIPTNAVVAYDISPLTGYVSLRIRATAYTSGSAVVTALPFAQAIEPQVQAYIDPNQTPIPTTTTGLNIGPTSVSALNGDLLPSTDVSNYRSYNIQITGTFTGTYTFQGSNDNFATTASTFPLQVLQANTNGGIVSNSGTSNITWKGPINFRYIRVRMTSYTSGTAVSVTNISAQLMDTFYNFSNVSQSGNWNIFTSPATSTTGLTSFYNGAVTALTAVKSSQARLHRIMIRNPDTANAVWVQFFNAANTGAVTLGTTIPLMPVFIPAGGYFEDFFMYSDNFSAGIVIATTTTPTGATLATTGSIVSLGYI